MGRVGACRRVLFWEVWLVMSRVRDDDGSSDVVSCISARGDIRVWSGLLFVVRSRTFSCSSRRIFA